jgi:hypothetical protein
LGKDGGAEAAVKATYLRTDLSETGVIRGDGQVAYHVQHVASADRVSGDHRHHGLRATPDLHVKVSNVKAPDRCAAGSASRVVWGF